MRDSEPVTTISELNSVFDGAELTTIVSQKDEEIRLLREQIARMNSGKLEQSVNPSWITKETDAVEQCLDEFRVAFNEAKQCILEKRCNEDISEDYEEKKKAARLIEEMNEVWMSAARDVKKHLNGITEKLNRCFATNTVRKTDTVKHVEEQLWKNVDLSDIPANELPILEMSDTVPVISAEAIKLCKSLVGTWNFDGASKCPDDIYVPSKLVISLHSSGFFRYDSPTRSGCSSFYCFRPDGKEYNIKSIKRIKRHCTVNGDRIVCRYGSSKSDALAESFRFLSENRIEFTTRSCNPGSNYETYIYIAARH